MAQSTLQITNMDGRVFNIRLIRTNQRYGSHAEMLHTAHMPLLEFFDTSEADEETSDELGYFTGIRCDSGILFSTAGSVGDATDKLFNEDFPMWGITDENIEAIRAWLEASLTERERRPPSPQGAIEQAAQPVEVISYADDDEPLPVDTQQMLEQVLAMLDQAETQDSIWQSGHIETRLNIIEAKKHVLKALQLLNFNT